MKTKIIISFLSLLLIAGAFGDGCEEEEPKPDYITVNVTTEGKFRLQLVGQTATFCYHEMYGKTIRVDVIKDGGERFNLFTQTDNSCNFSTSAVSFKLYREQPIEIITYLEQVDSGYTQVRGVDYLSWDAVFPQHDFGETYNYNSSVNLIWLYTLQMFFINLTGSSVKSIEDINKAAYK